MSAPIPNHLGGEGTRVCWEKASFSYQRRDGTFYLVVHEGKIRTAPDFQKIWARDYPIGSLWATGKNQKWGWLNQGFFRTKYKKQLKIHGISCTTTIMQLFDENRT
jgi:hypothetical protein